MSSESLLSLPEEVVAHIVSFLPDSAFLAFAGSCRKLYRIGNAPVELRRRCLKYRFWDERHSIEAKRRQPPAEVDWWTLFTHRYRVERATATLLNAIIECPTHRIARNNKIVDFGYDAMDYLRRNAEIGEDEADDVLARRWHATAALRYIHRRRALKIWKRLEAHEDVPIEEALGALDIFISKTAGPDLDDTLRQLDALAAQFRDANPDFYDLSTLDKSLRLIAWMHEQGFHGATPDRYRALKNCLIGMTIRSVRTAIPLTLVAIFCALARRFSLEASPCGYPWHVIAIVTDEVSGEKLYFDPYHPESKVLDRHELEMAIVGVIGASPVYVERVLSPASTSEMVVRAADNMIETLQQNSRDRLAQAAGYPEVDEDAALYAALTIVVVLRQSPVRRNVVHHMTEQLLSEFPMDVRFLEEEVLVRVGHPTSHEVLQRVCEALRETDVGPRPVSRRNAPDNKAVRHRIGTIFRHLRYDYVGVIFGWTSTCQPDEGPDWIERNRVDTLSRGRKQPFYNVLVDRDDGSVYYVAEENIMPIKPESAPQGLIDRGAGKYFKRFCKNEGRFVSNVKIEFPDD